MSTASFKGPCNLMDQILFVQVIKDYFNLSPLCSAEQNAVKGKKPI